MRKTAIKPRESLPLTATPRPGDFPVGSLESRAAARAMLQHAESERERITIISHIPRPEWEWDGEGPAPADWNKKIHVGEWSECPDGRLFRMVNVPPGVTWHPNEPASDVEIVHGDYPFPQPRPVELPAWEPHDDGDAAHDGTIEPPRRD